MSSAILILLHWDAVRANLVRDLMDAGVAVKAVLQDGRTAADMPDFVQHVTRADIQDGKCTSI